MSQTWDEIQRLNENIRRGLQTDGLIGKEDTVVTACVRRDLTPAQKRDKRFYDDDSILVFQRKTGGIGRGETGRLPRQNCGLCAVLGFLPAALEFGSTPLDRQKSEVWK